MSSRFSEPKTEEEAQRLRRFLRDGAETVVKVIETISSIADATATIKDPALLKFNSSLEALAAALKVNADRRVTISFEIADMQAPNEIYAPIFINKPDASAQTPSDEPSYAGALGFFRHDPTHQPSSADVVGRYEFDITQTVRKLAPTGAALTISVVLAPLTKAGAPSIRVRSAKLIVVESLVRRKS